MIVLNPVTEVSDISDFWGAFALRLHGGIKEHGIDNFLQWRIVKDCMVHNIKRSELKKLKDNPDWDLIKDHVYEDKFGNPKNNKNLLHHAYSLIEFGWFNIRGIKNIYEFGGGYGGLCKLIFRLGFKGIYTIRDIPVLCYLQRQYLSRVVPSEKIIDTNRNDYSPEVDILIAMWSLSESPLKTRDDLFKRIKFDRCLIAFQKKFQKYNNLKYFKSLIKSMPEYNWNMSEIKHLPNNYYLFGEKK